MKLKEKDRKRKRKKEKKKREGKENIKELIDKKKELKIKINCL